MGTSSGANELNHHKTVLELFIKTTASFPSPVQCACDQIEP